MSLYWYWIQMGMGDFVTTAPVRIALAPANLFKLATKRVQPHYVTNRFSIDAVLPAVTQRPQIVTVVSPFPKITKGKVYSPNDTARTPTVPTARTTNRSNTDTVLPAVTARPQTTTVASIFPEITTDKVYNPNDTARTPTVPTARSNTRQTSTPTPTTPQLQPTNYTSHTTYSPNDTARTPSTPAARRTTRTAPANTTPRTPQLQPTNYTSRTTYSPNASVATQYTPTTPKPKGRATVRSNTSRGHTATAILPSITRV